MTKTASRIRLHSKSQARGFSLIEVLVTLAIITLVSTAIGFAAYNYFIDSKKTTALNEARTVRTAVKAHALQNDVCPTLEVLIADGVLDEDSPKQDPWGNAWRIRCDGTRVIVETDGPDRQRGTADDVRVPAAQEGTISATTGG